MATQTAMDASLLPSGPSAAFSGWTIDREFDLAKRRLSFQLDGQPLYLNWFSYDGSRADVYGFCGIFTCNPSCPVGTAPPRVQ